MDPVIKEENIIAITTETSKIHYTNFFKIRQTEQSSGNI